MDRVLNQGWSVPAAAEAAGISRRTAYKWLKRFKLEGQVGLLDRSSRPHQSPRRLELEKADIVIELRRKKRMTAAKIAAVLHLARSTVARLLNATTPDGCLWSSLAPASGRGPETCLHVDTKKLGRFIRPGHRVHGDRTTRIRGVGWEDLHVAIDDPTRLAYAEILRDEKARSSIAFLRKAQAWYARHGIEILRVLSDNGPCYMDRFTNACAQLGIWHLRTRPYRRRARPSASPGRCSANGRT